MTYGHLQADCLYTGISSGPNARCRVWEAFTFFNHHRCSDAVYWRAGRERAPDLRVQMWVRPCSKHMLAGALALSSFLFHFPLFSDVLLWMSCKILWDETWAPKFVGLPCSAEQSELS